MMIEKKDYKTLRALYPKFIYHRYHYEVIANQLFVKYFFEIEGLESFEPEWYFPLENKAEGISLEHPMLKRLIFCLGMMELISYWKLTASPEVEIKASRLNQKEIAFFKEVYFHGLGEYFYQNGIETTQEDFMFFSVREREKETFLLSLGCPCCIHLPEPKESVLLPIGGGKDSIVSLELLKKANIPFTAFSIQANGAIQDTLKCAGLKTGIEAKRVLDSKLLALNQKGFLNGHTPFSALLAFSSVLTAYLLGLRYVALSNEASANESSVHGLDVNHQWSKSSHFEQLFQNFCKTQLGVHQQYFSLLRPWHEIKIAQVFSQLEQYHQVFKSCNRGSKTATWCNHCAKCLFVCILLSAFLDSNQIEKIFGENLLDKKSLLAEFQALLGETHQKPFECVGTVDEVHLALQLALVKFLKQNDPPTHLPVLLQYYYEKWGKNLSKSEDELLASVLLKYGIEAYTQLPPLFKKCIEE